MRYAIMVDCVKIRMLKNCKHKEASLGKSHQ